MKERYRVQVLNPAAKYIGSPPGTDQAAIARDFFGPRKLAQCDLAFEGAEAAGIATYYWTYGSFAAARGLFVEDNFVRPAFRGRGYGKALFRNLAAQGIAAGAVKLEWLVLDWNETAMEFYNRIGARPVRTPARDAEQTGAALSN